MHFLKRPALVVTLCGLLAAMVPPAVRAQAPDSLVLQQPENFNAWSVYDAVRRTFTVWMTWDDPVDSLASFVHQPDTTGWAVTSPSDSMTASATTRSRPVPEMGSGRPQKLPAAQASLAAPGRTGTGAHRPRSRRKMSSLAAA